jgi:ribosomal protein S18 acetylase RimI-like enzyme
MSLLRDESLREFSKGFEVSDLAKIFYLIEKNALSRDPYWTEENYLAHILSSEDRVFLLKENEKITAFVFYRVIVSEMEITHWSVLEKGKGRGAYFFKEFLAQCGKKATKIYLECGEWNKAADNIYKKFSFTKTGFRPSYYKTGEGAWVMERNLNS